MTEPALRAPEFSMQKIAWQVYRTAIWRAATPSHERPLLFFNGIGANLELAQPLADAFPDRDIVTFDMPGIGGSPSPVIPYRPWMIAIAAGKILDRLAIGDVDVIGVSWGGGAAQQFAIQNSRRTKKLILCATSTGMTMVPGKLDVLSKMATPQRYLDKDYMIKNFEKLYGDEPEFANKHAFRITPPSMRGYMYQMLAMVGWTSLPFLPFLKVPTLIMAGDKDRIVPLVNAKIIKAALPGARLHVVHGGGHLFLISRLSEILPVLRDFLAEPVVARRSWRAPKAAIA